MIKIDKLDGRHFGNLWFSHRAEITQINDRVAKYRQFNDIRVWCWENYGPSCEVDYVYACYAEENRQHTHTTFSTPLKWSWRATDNRVFVYLKQDALTHFHLKWM